MALLAATRAQQRRRLPEELDNQAVWRRLLIAAQPPAERGALPRRVAGAIPPLPTRLAPSPMDQDDSGPRGPVTRRGRVGQGQPRGLPSHSQAALSSDRFIPLTKEAARLR
jgi:hypothetical protein